MTTTSPNRRAYAMALALLAIGAVVLLVAFGLPWASADVPLLAGSTDAVRSQQVSGRDLFPGAAMSGWVALAAVAGIVATRSWGRIVVAVVAAIAALAALVAVVRFVTGWASLVDGNVGALVGATSPVASQSTPAWLLAAVGGLVVLTAAAWTAARGRAWPALGSRYERPAREAPSMSHWDAQDAGRDPTDDLVE